MLLELPEFEERCAGLYFIWVETIHRTIEIVGQNEPFVGSKHANSVRHVCQRRVQKHIGMLETLFCAISQKLSSHTEAGYNQDQQS